MDVLDAREKIKVNAIISCYNLKEHPTVQRCRVIQYPYSINKYYPDEKRFWDYSKIILKSMDSEEKEFVSNIKHIFLTEEEAQEDFEKHIKNNIEIYEREIKKIKKEMELKLKTYEEGIKKYKKLIKNLEKQKEITKNT